VSARPPWRTLANAAFFKEKLNNGNKVTGKSDQAPQTPPPPETTAAWLQRFNASGLSDEERRALILERFAHMGEGVVIRPPFHCDFGHNISLGRGVFMNFNCVILDVERVSIGDLTAIGPGVQILASDHPRDPELRRRQVRYGRAVDIGSNVWIGGGAIILPGVKIGDDAIVGAGSIVTRDVPAGVTVMGNPARARAR